MPVRLFELNVMCCRLVSFETAPGSAPVREFVSNVTYVRPERLPSEGLSAPAMVLALRVSATTTLFVQMTPVKAQAVA